MEDSAQKSNCMEDVLRRIQLPSEILKSYHNFGVKDLYDWQVECLFSTGIWDGGHLIYCAPTSGGKTLVAELLLLKTAILRKKTVIFVLPYVSLVTEKESYLKKLLARYNRSRPLLERVKVRGFFGDHCKGSRSYKENVLVCTIEKANQIFNSLITRGRGHQLGCVVFDEVHSLGSSFNGHLLEILISKIKYMEFTAQQSTVRVRWTLEDILDIPLLDGDQHAAAMRLLHSSSSSSGSAAAATARATMSIKIQMIALSATMGNVQQLSDWLGGRLYTTAFRPIPLVERIKAGNEVLDSKGVLLGCIPPLNKVQAAVDTDHTVFLSQQALGAGRQVLVFCPSKAMCLQTCRAIVDVLTSSTTLVGSTDNMHVWSHSIALGGSSSEATAAKRQELLAARHVLLAALQSENSRCSLDSILKASIVHGIAYHHAGLSAGIRSLVESGFRSGTLSILAATSTLAAGINLPAGRVLIRSLNIGKDFLSVMQYKQMCGRAGRMGQGSNGVGESFLLVKASEKARAVALSSQPMPHVRSQLHPRRDGGNALLKALLEAVGLGLCSSVQQAVQFVQQTLLYRQAACPESGSADTAAAQVSKPQEIISMSLSIVVFLVNCRMIDSSERMLYSANPLEHADHLIHLCMHDPRWVSMDEGSSDDADRCTLRIPLKITRFGKAILQSNTDPDDAIVMYESLLRAQDGLHLESPLHLLYLVSPLDHQLQPSFRRLLSIYESSRSSSSKHPLLASIFDSIGIDFSALNRWCVSAPTRAAIDICSNAVRLHSLAASTCDSSSTYRHMSREDWQVLCRCKRIWAAMVLQGLVDGRPMTALGKEFDVDVASIETLLRDSLMMISKVIRFCAEIGWSSMERIFTDFKPQLLVISADQCSEELQSLMAVPMMSSKMARVLHQASVRDRESFLAASAESLAQLLQLSIGFELQELERVEIQLEQSEQSVVGGSLPLVEVEEGTAAAASASIQTSSATASSSVMPLSRDEHMRLRLVALISSLQFAARQADEQRLVEVDAAACDAMAAIHQYDHLPSGGEGQDLLHNAAAADVSSDGDLYSDSSEGNLSTRPDDAADPEMSDDTAAMDSEPEMEEDLDEHVSMDAYSPSEGCRLDAYSRQGAVVEAEELGRGPLPLTAHSEWLVGPSIMPRHRTDRSPVAKAAKVIHEAHLAPLKNPFETIGEKMDLKGCESIAEVEVDDVPTTLSVWPSTDRQQQQVMHKITISPLQPLSASLGSMDTVGGDMALSWALSDVDLNALMEELESSGVLELSSSSSSQQQLQHHPIDLLYGVHTIHASGGGIDAALHFPSEGQHYVYYPMLPPMDEVRRQHSAVSHPASSDSPTTRALGLPIMPFNEDFRSPAKAIAAAALLSKSSNSAYKISVYSSYARKDVEVDQAHATDEGYLFNRSPAHDDGVRVEACNDRSDGMVSDGEWGDEAGAAGVEGIGVDPSYLTAADDDCENSRDSNVSCSDVLKESFENSVTITTSNSKQLYVPIASTLYSPYATPFTPSKVRTPGMYLYYPLWQSDRRQRPGSCAVDGFARLVNGTAPTGDAAARSGGRRVGRLGPQYPSEVVSSETSFGVRDVRSDAHCMQFLKQLKRSRCVSFELLFRPIPSAWLAHYKAPQETSISMSRIDGKSAAAKLVDKCANVCSWTPYVSWACIKLSSVTCSVSDHYLESSLQQSSDGSLKRNMFRHPHVLVGAALCFGDEFGYYLPLPTPLPLVPNPYTTTSQGHYYSSSSSSRMGIRSVMEAFPSSIREAIATYVGFGNILNKCPLLEAYFSQQDQKEQHITESLQMKSVCLSEMSSNPLFLVSRGWCHSTRAALLMAWRKGACIEWKLFADIMRNANLTKVAMHVKSKMVVLRERDVLVEGPVEDPSIAQTIITTTQWPEPLRPSSHTGGKSIVSIKVPKLKPSTAQTAPSLELLLNGKKIACFRAVAVMRAMAKMEEQLRQCSMIDLFRNIEMPLQYCSADAELGGIKVDPAFFSRLRQGLMDRREAIQSYCRVFCGQAFNVDSHVDVCKVKKDIVSKIRHGVPTAATAAKTGEKDSIEAVVAASHPFMRLISEYRSHVRTLPLCSSILGNRYFDRVRPVYNTIGTETGRVIIVNPPLQQVPKACQYLHCDRMSVHEELCSSSCDPMAADRMISAFNARHGTATRSDAEWVHVASLGGPPHLEAGSGWVHSFCTGKLVHILDLSVSAPPHASTDHSTAALVDLWRAAGFDYSDAEADSIRQVLVEFPSDRDNTTRPDACPSVGVRRYAYPADKVYRLTSGIKPDPSEFESIRTSLSQPSQWWFLQQSVASQTAFSKPTTASSSSLPPGCSSRQRVAVNVRSGFQANEGFVLLAADYCQIELRILSHFSSDPSLLAAFHRVGFDVFKAIAASWLGSRGGGRGAAADSEVTDEERNQVKQICYALIYGAGPQLVADQAGISVDRAKAMMKDFLGRYPGVQRFLHSLKQRSRKIGYVETLLGRRRYLSGLGSGDRKLRARAERQAVNTLCQGSAADLIKLAMINIHCRLAQQSVPLNFRRQRQHPGAGLYRLLDDVRPVLQVHDELVFEVREEHLSAVAAIVKDCMENAVVLNVPLLVKLSTGSSWGSLSLLSLTAAAAAHLQDTMITAPHPPVSLYQTAVMSSSKHSSIDAIDNASGQLMDASRHAVVARDLFGRD